MRTLLLRRHRSLADGEDSGVACPWDGDTLLDRAASLVICVLDKEPVGGLQQLPSFATNTD